MKHKFTESDLAKVVVDALLEWGWEVYQEVQGHAGRCDIVARRGNILWGIECKMTFGLAVIEQAVNWRGHCNYVSVATPYRGSMFAQRLCKDYGIGILVVNLFSDDGTVSGEVREWEKGRLSRHTSPPDLHELQKTLCAAGSATGGHWTPFRQTVKSLVNAVKGTPGVEFGELIKILDHHYSSFNTAKSCLRGFIGTDVIPELRTEIVGGKLCVFLREAI